VKVASLVLNLKKKKDNNRLQIMMKEMTNSKEKIRHKRRKGKTD
jgi:hypothetical protein